MNWEVFLSVARLTLGLVAALALGVSVKDLFQFRTRYAIFIWWLVLPTLWTTVAIFIMWLLFRKKLTTWWDNLE